MISYSTVLIATVIGLAPVVLWLKILISYNKKHSHKISTSLNIFFVGVLCAFLASIFEIAGSELRPGGLLSNFGFIRPITFLGTAGTLLFVALVEELSKGLGIIYLLKYQKNIFRTDGLIWGTTVGLGFGLTENGIYFANNIGKQPWMTFVSIVVLRFLLSTSAHILYSGISGYFISKALTVKKISKKNLWKNLLVGLTLAVVIHTIFNALLGTVFAFFVVLLIILGFWLLARLYKNALTHRLETF